MRREKNKCQSGFSVIELMVVCLVILIVAGYAVPNVLNFIHMAKLRGSASDYASLLQVGRIRSVQDDTFYKTYVIAGPPQQAYVDLTNNGGTGVAPGDPSIQVSSEVIPIAKGGAPDTANLSGQFLPAGSGVIPQDATATPVIFSPRGLPCTTQLAGAVCTSAGGPTAYWAFFENNINKVFEAVTVSPAGRVQKWQHGTGGWSKL
ncbi:MAG TPA: prepilin-type N-terminal cleavage/methylation domain-containing protein [Candidatus Acidoferrales bacterium]|nr:prepilin-type N-terminal cleavage/methylation domain-containing protein [Candidatus Acidoferrales bacterium]